MMVSAPFISELVSLNEMMKLPSALGGMERWMKDTEEEAAQITEKFLDVHSAGGFLVNMLMIAVIPALGEEMMFRGLLQRLLGEWFKNIHIFSHFFRLQIYSSLIFVSSCIIRIVDYFCNSF